MVLRVLTTDKCLFFVFSCFSLSFLLYCPHRRACLRNALRSCVVLKVSFSPSDVGQPTTTATMSMFDSMGRLQEVALAGAGGQTSSQRSAGDDALFLLNTKLRRGNMLERTLRFLLAAHLLCGACAGLTRCSVRSSDPRHASPRRWHLLVTSR